MRLRAELHCFVCHLRFSRKLSVENVYIFLQTIIKLLTESKKIAPIPASRCLKGFGKV